MPKDNLAMDTICGVPFYHCQRVKFHERGLPESISMLAGCLGTVWGGTPGILIVVVDGKSGDKVRSRLFQIRHQGVPKVLDPLPECHERRLHMYHDEAKADAIEAAVKRSVFTGWPEESVTDSAREELSNKMKEKKVKKPKATAKAKPKVKPVLKKAVKAPLKAGKKGGKR